MAGCSKKQYAIMMQAGADGKKLASEMGSMEQEAFNKAFSELLGSSGGYNQDDDEDYRDFDPDSDDDYGFDEDDEYNKEMTAAQEENANMRENEDYEASEDFSKKTKEAEIENLQKMVDKRIAKYGHTTEELKDELKEAGYVLDKNNKVIPDATTYNDADDFRKGNPYDPEKLPDEGMSQEEYEARIKPEAEKFKKQLDDAGYQLKQNEYGVEKKPVNNKRIVVRPHSGIGADGFDVDVYEGDKLTKTDKYSYGYNASWNKDFSQKEKPFVTDILQKYADEHGIDMNNFEVEDGNNTFSGKKVSGSDFKDRYFKKAEEKTQGLSSNEPSSVGNRLKFKLPNQEEQTGTIESVNENGINAFGKKQKLYTVRTPDGRKIEVNSDYVIKPEYPGGMGDYVYELNNPVEYPDKKHRPTKNQKAFTPEQRQAIRDQINKMVASLDDARSIEEGWDIEQGIIELEDMLKKYKGK